MTSNKLNNIMRTTKLNLSSMVLSKNTSEILKSCVGKLYRQVPMKFKKSLEQVKTDTAMKTENRGPIAVLQMQERRCQRLNPLMIKPVVKTKPSFNIKRSNTQISAIYKKLLQIPSNRLGTARRFGSSNSSSNGSLWHRSNEKHRSTRGLHFQAIKSTAKTKPVFNPNILDRNGVSLVIPARNQHMSSHLGSLPQAIEVSSNIQRDLMIIDNLLKNRLNSVSIIKPSDTKTNVPPKSIKVREQCPTTLNLPKNIEEILIKSELNQSEKCSKTPTQTKPLEKSIGKLETQSIHSNPTTLGTRTKQLETIGKLETLSIHSNPTTVRRYSNPITFLKTPIKSSTIQLKDIPRKTTTIIPSQPQVSAKESLTKSYAKKTIKSLSIQQPEKRLPKPSNLNVKGKSSRQLWELKNLQKVNGIIAPTATYCFAKPSRCNRMTYIRVQPKFQ